MMKACWIMQNMIVEECVDGFAGVRIGGTRAPIQEIDDNIDYVTIDSGMLGLSAASWSTVKSSDEHFVVQ